MDSFPFLAVTQNRIIFGEYFSWNGTHSIVLRGRRPTAAVMNWFPCIGGLTSPEACAPEPGAGGHGAKYPLTDHRMISGSRNRLSRHAVVRGRFSDCVNRIHQFAAGGNHLRVVNFVSMRGMGTGVRGRSLVLVQAFGQPDVRALGILVRNADSDTRRRDFSVGESNSGFPPAQVSCRRLPGFSLRNRCDPWHGP